LRTLGDPRGHPQKRGGFLSEPRTRGAPVESITKAKPKSVVESRVMSVEGLCMSDLRHRLALTNGVSAPRSVNRWL
ncbi:MAG: hypothetical protein WCN98_18340, partial [Verrucomicrobiaceae bacterium]